jgi:NADP-dependent 3-hydroxy acid dehydrogenase YdfG
MRERGSGLVITIGSIADHLPLPGNAAYAASKFGLRGLHGVLAAELAGTGVRATLVAPGPVDTELWDAVDPDTRPGFTKRRDMLRAEDIAEAVLFVATRPAHVVIPELFIEPRR